MSLTSPWVEKRCRKKKLSYVLYFEIEDYGNYLILLRLSEVLHKEY
jgi:hypothetical protein